MISLYNILLESQDYCEEYTVKNYQEHKARYNSCKTW